MLDKHFRTICIVLGVFILGFISHMATTTASVTAMQRTEQDRSALAFGTCVRAIENAAYDLRWTGRHKFHSDGIAHPDEKILLFGDEAEAQNGFGAWMRVNYFCTFDPKTKQTKVSIERGRFPR